MHGGKKPNKLNIYMLYVFPPILVGWMHDKLLEDWDSPALFAAQSADAG